MTNLESHSRTPFRPVRGSSLAVISALAIGIAGCGGDREAPANTGPRIGIAGGETNYRLHLDRGRERFEAGDWTAAETDLRRAIAIRPEEIEPRFLLGKTYYAGNHYRKAEEEFHALLRLDPESLDGRIGLIRICLKEGRGDEVDSLVGEILEIDADHPEGLFYRGLRAGRRGDYQDAVADLRRVIEKVPEHLEARYQLGLALMKSERGEAAIEEFREVLRRDPGHRGAQQHLAGTLRREGREEEAKRAEEAYRKFREGVDRNREILELRERAVQAYNAGDLSRALAAFQEIVALAPQDSQAVAYLGSTHLALGNRDEARRFLERAIRLDPRNAFAFMEIGRWHALAEDLPQAEEALKRAVEINPDFSLPHYFLSGIYRSLNRTADSDREMAEFRRLEKLSPDSSLSREREYW